MNSLEILRELIKHDSQFTKSNLSIVKYIASLFPKENIQIVELEKDGLRIFNLIVKFEGKNHSNPLIFSGHTDTVPTSSKWTRDPFDPIIADNKIFGLGSTDMKAGLAAIISAAQTINSQPGQDIYLLFDADEEGSSTGGKNFISNLNFENADIVIPEPTDGIIFFGQKGALDIDVTFHGISAHSSMATYDKNQSDNAIYKAAQFISKMQEIEQKLNISSDAKWGPKTQSICTIKGGTANNVIASECTVGFSRRTMPDENLEDIIYDYTEIPKGIDPNAQVKINFTGESFEIDQNSTLLQIVKNISQNIFGNAETKIAPYWTQAGLFKKWGNCIIWGPGSIDQAHQADEYCEIDKLEKMTECFKKLIKSRL